MLLPGRQTKALRDPTRLKVITVNGKQAKAQQPHDSLCCLCHRKPEMPDCRDHCEWLKGTHGIKGSRRPNSSG